MSLKVNKLSLNLIRFYTDNTATKQIMFAVSCWYECGSAS